MTTVHAGPPAKLRSRKLTVDLGHRVDVALDALMVAISLLRKARAMVVAGGLRREPEVVRAAMEYYSAARSLRYALLEMAADIRRYAGDPDTVG